MCSSVGLISCQRWSPAWSISYLINMYRPNYFYSVTREKNEPWTWIDNLYCTKCSVSHFTKKKMGVHLNLCLLTSRSESQMYKIPWYFQRLWSESLNLLTSWIIKFTSCNIVMQVSTMLTVHYMLWVTVP